MTATEPTALERLKAYVKTELKAGRQITWKAAFATSRPALKHIRHWFPDVPPGLTKAQAIEWLAGEALKEEQE